MLVCSTLKLLPSHPSPSFLSHRSTLPPAYVSHKEERALPQPPILPLPPWQTQCFSPHLLILFVLCLEKHKLTHNLRKWKRQLITVNSRNTVLKCYRSRIKTSWIFPDEILMMMTREKKMVCWDLQCLSLFLKHNLKQFVSHPKRYEILVNLLATDFFF